jgi:hypothetical protein
MPVAVNTAGGTVASGDRFDESWSWQAGPVGLRRALTALAASVIASLAVLWVPTQDLSARTIATERSPTVDDGVLELGQAEALDGSVMSAVVVAIVPAARGAWVMARDGGVFALGGAPFHGSAVGRWRVDAVGGFALGDGYVVVAKDGRLATFGSAAPAVTPSGLRGSVVEVVALRDGALLVTDVGDVATVSSTARPGSLSFRPQVTLDVVSAGVTADERGLWLVRRSGEVITVANAPALGNVGADVVAIVADPGGVYVAHRDGSLAVVRGSAVAVAARCGARPVAAVARRGDGWWLATSARAPVATNGLAPLAALDAVNEDLVDQVRLSQACQPRGDVAALKVSRPLRGARTTSRYGRRIHPVYKVPQFHRGVDLAGGDAVARALASGTVIDVSTRVGYGTIVVIDHGGQRSSLGAHLASASVKVGDQVGAGQIVGKVGATGYATGPHLHVEVRVAGVVVDPAPLVERAR